MSKSCEGLHQFLASYSEWEDQIKKCLITKQKFTKEDLMQSMAIGGVIEMPESSNIALRQDPVFLMENIADAMKSYKVGVVLCYNKSMLGGNENSCEAAMRYSTGYYEILESCKSDLESSSEEDCMTLMYQDVPLLRDGFTIDEVREGLSTFTLMLCNAEIDTTDPMFKIDHEELMNMRYGKLNFILFKLLQSGCQSIAIITDEFNRTEHQYDKVSRELFINDIAHCVQSIMQIVPRFELFIGGRNVCEVGEKFRSIWQGAGEVKE